MPYNANPGLLGKNMATGDGTHLHHASAPPVICYLESEIDRYKALGYTEEYVYQEYPKVVHGRGTARDAEHEKALLADPIPDPVTGGPGQ